MFWCKCPQGCGSDTDLRVIDSTAVLRNNRRRDVPAGNPGNSVFIYHRGIQRSSMFARKRACLCKHRIGWDIIWTSMDCILTSQRTTWRFWGSFSYWTRQEKRICPEPLPRARSGGNFNSWHIKSTNGSPAAMVADLQVWPPKDKITPWDRNLAMGNHWSHFIVNTTSMNLLWT